MIQFVKLILLVWIEDYNGKILSKLFCLWNMSENANLWKCENLVQIGLFWISAVQHERGPRKPKLHSALLASGAHQSHLQIQGLVSSTYAQNAAHSGFHPVIPHIHHPQPLPFSPILHPSHHPHAQAHHGHHLLHVPSTNEFYKNFHPVSWSNILVWIRSFWMKNLSLEWNSNEDFEIEEIQQNQQIKIRQLISKTKYAFLVV